MELSIRRLKESDWDLLTQMWSSWEWDEHLDKDLLPDNGTGGFIVEKNNEPIVAGFLYSKNSRLWTIGWPISNKNYRGADRKEAVELLLKGMENVAKASGCKALITLASNKTLIETHKKLGWTVDYKTAYEVSKKITQNE